MKQFSINEAERLIPILTPLILRAQDLKKELEEYEEVTLRRRMRTDGSYELELLDAEHNSLKELFYETVEKISEFNCNIKDLDEGLIDFPTLFEGRKVFLSWRLGERRITHWREKDDDIYTRRKIIEL